MWYLFKENLPAGDMEFQGVFDDFCLALNSMGKNYKLQKFQLNKKYADEEKLELPCYWKDNGGVLHSWDDNKRNWARV